ncbi:MAG: hypothetical protein AABW80_02300 [Nanoarchaeota archaeon]
MENGRKIVIILILIVIAFILGFLIGKIGNLSITGKVVDELNGMYSWTSAICDENRCIDVLIECENGNVVNIMPLSKDFVEFDSDWKDPRGELREYCR